MNPLCLRQAVALPHVLPASQLAGVVGVGLQLFRFDMFGVELRDLGALVIEPDDSVEGRHGGLLCIVGGLINSEAAVAAAGFLLQRLLAGDAAGDFGAELQALERDGQGAVLAQAVFRAAQALQRFVDMAQRVQIAVAASQVHFPVGVMCAFTVGLLQQLFARMFNPAQLAELVVHGLLQCLPTLEQGGFELRKLHGIQMWAHGRSPRRHARIAVPPEP